MATNLDSISDSIAAFAKRGGITPRQAFAAWFAIQFHDIDEDDALEAAAADGGRDQGIDIAFADQNLGEIIVIQAFVPEKSTNVTKKAKWDAVVASIPFIRDPESLAKSGRPDLAEMVQSLKDENPGFKLSFGLITLGAENADIRENVAAHRRANRDADLSYFYFPLEVILEKYSAIVDAEGGIPDDELKFAGQSFSDTGSYGKAWIGSIEASELIRLHQAHGDKLFAGNIRLFLGARKGGINEQIIRTAQDNPGNFWALNNGITIVADSATISTTKKDGSSLRLKRFSIVNGCQTTSSLVRAQAKKGTKVLARIIEAKSGLRNDIVRYNNSQNAVRIWTVRAADPIQEELRNAFRGAGIDYAPKQSGSRTKKRLSTIELDKVTQFLASKNADHLLTAINNKSELFDQPYTEIFKRDINARDVYFAWLIGNVADEERQAHAARVGTDHNKIIGAVTSAYWVIFCTYRLLERFANLDSAVITLERMQSSDFQGALRKYVARGVTLFFDAAIDTYDRDDFGTVRSTLRSPKFLSRMESKIASRVANLPKRELPDLVAAAKSARPGKTGAKPGRSTVASPAPSTAKRSKGARKINVADGDTAKKAPRLARGEKPKAR